MENLYPKHELVSRTYSKKSFIKASTFGSKSKFFITMSIPSQDKPLTNRSVNDPRDFAKPVKAIALPQDVPSTSDRRLIELENQVQCLMEAHLALTQPTQVNKITTPCEICSGPHDTQYCKEDPEQAFIEYSSSRTDEAGGMWYTFKPEQNNLGDTYNPSWKSHPNVRWRQPQNSQKNFSNPPNHFQSNGSISNHSFNNRPQNFNNQSNIEGLVSEFMASQDARLSKFEANFKRQQEEPEPTLKDEFQDLHLNLPVLEVLAHAPIYNAILDKYVESLKLGKNGSAFIPGEILAKIEDPGLFSLPCRLGDSKPFDTLADLGSCVNIIPLYLFKKLNIGLLEETDHIFGLADETKSYPVGIVKDVEVHIGKLKLLNDFYVIDMKKHLKTPLLVGRGFLATTNAVIDCRMTKITVREGIGVKGVDIGAIPINLKCNMWESEDLVKKPINWDKPPKNKDGAWHAKIRLIDPDGEEFTKTLQSIPTTRKLSERESPREIIDLDHFYDT
ncbi:MAK10-like protein [Tanacetum coccineum]